MENFEMKNFKISSDGFMKADCKISGKHADLYSVRNLSDGPVTKFGKLSIIGNSFLMRKFWKNFRI